MLLRFANIVAFRSEYKQGTEVMHAGGLYAQLTAAVGGKGLAGMHAAKLRAMLLPVLLVNWPSEPCIRHNTA